MACALRLRLLPRMFGPRSDAAAEHEPVLAFLTTPDVAKHTFRLLATGFYIDVQ